MASYTHTSGAGCSRGHQGDPRDGGHDHPVLDPAGHEEGRGAELHSLQAVREERLHPDRARD